MSSMKKIVSLRKVSSLEKYAVLAVSPIKYFSLKDLQIKIQLPLAKRCYRHSIR